MFLRCFCINLSSLGSLVHVAPQHYCRVEVKDCSVEKMGWHLFKPIQSKDVSAPGFVSVNFGLSHLSWFNWHFKDIFSGLEQVVDKMSSTGTCLSFMGIIWAMPMSSLQEQKNCSVRSDWWSSQLVFLRGHIRSQSGAHTSPAASHSSFHFLCKPPSSTAATLMILDAFPCLFCLWEQSMWTDGPGHV